MSLIPPQRVFLPVPELVPHPVPGLLPQLVPDVVPQQVVPALEAVLRLPRRGFCGQFFSDDTRSSMDPARFVLTFCCTCCM